MGLSYFVNCMEIPRQIQIRDPASYKNDFGHVLIIAGSKCMIGAAALSALAAYRSGAGLVTLAVPSSLLKVAQCHVVPEVMMLALPETAEEAVDAAAFDVIKSKFSKFSVIGVGPGLGTDSSTHQFVCRLVAESPIPLVIDADALNIIAADPKVLSANDSIKVLTPHPGEMIRLMGRDNKLAEQERLAVARNFAHQYGCTLVLKGERTVVAAPEIPAYVNASGNPGMATAGSGDVLTGMISAFIAQGLPSFEAAKWGVYIHGLCGDLAAERLGQASLMASDLIAQIPHILSQ